MIDFLEYYKENQIDLSPIKNHNFRHFRFRLFTGKFCKVLDRIHSYKDLRKHLLREKPADVYYSVSWWLSPENVGLKSEGKDRIIGSDLFFDLDVNEKLKTLEDVRQETLRLVDFLDEKGIGINYIAFSGAKGFHVSCKGEPLGKYGLMEREAAAERSKKEIADEIVRRGMAIDHKVTVDTRRIVRLPGTVNSKTGRICTILSRREMEKEAEEIIKNITRVKVPALRSESNDRWLRHLAEFLVGDRLRVRSPQYYYSTFITSHALSDRHVLILRFHKNAKRLEERLRRLQETYKIGDFYLFSDANLLEAVSMHTFQKKRVEKIMRASRCINLNSFLKYGESFFRVGRSRDPSGKEVEGPPKFLRIIESGNNSGLVSRPHHSFFSQFIKAKEYGSSHGKKNLKMVHSIICTK